MVNFNALLNCILRRIFQVALGLTALISPATIAAISLPADVGQGIFSNCTFDENEDEVICSSITNFDEQNYTINITQRLRLTVQGNLTLPGGLTINPQQQPFVLNVLGAIQNNGSLLINGNVEAATFILSNSASRIIGNIQAGSFIMNDGNIVGQIDATSVNLGNGTVSGNVTAASLTNSAIINGNVTAGSLMNNRRITGNARVFNPSMVSTELVTNNGSGFIGSVNSNGGVRNDGEIGSYINTPYFLGNRQPPHLCNTNPQDGNTTPCINGEVAQNFCEGVTAGLDYGIIGTSGFVYSRNNYINNEPIRHPEGGLTGEPTTPTPNGIVASEAPGFAPLEVSFPSHMLGSNTITEEEQIPPGSYGTVRTVQGGGPPSGNLVSFAGGGSYDYADTDNIHYIRRLELKGNRSRAVFGPGVYFIDEIIATSQTYLEVAPQGRVVIHIGKRFRSDNETYIHSAPGANPGNFMINLHPGATFSVGNGNQGTNLFNFNGFIYSPYEDTSITLAKNNSVRGSILSSGIINVGNNTTFEFTDEIRQQITAAVGCNEPTHPVIERFRIEQPPRILSCRAAPVRVTACANADCSERFIGPISATLQASNNVNWQGGSLVNTTDTNAIINFVDGQALVGMRNISGGDVRLDIVNTSPVGLLPPLCESPGCLTSFVTSGLDVQTVPLSRAGDFVGTNISAVITASDGSCQPRLQNQTQPLRVTFNCTDPGCAANQTFDLYDESLSSMAEPFGFNEVNFNNQGEVTIFHQYSDVGQFLLNVEVALDEAPAPDEPNIDDPEIRLLGTSPPFYATPYSLEAFAYRDGARFTDLNESFATAGEPFQIEIQALNSFGNPTPSFGLESIEPALSLTFISATQPDTGNLGEGNEVDGEQLHVNQISQDFNAGSLILSNVVWDEVGELNVRAELNSYFTFSSTENEVFFNSIHSNRGQLSRFVPAYFELGLSSVINAFDRVEHPECMASANFDFTYLGQPASEVRYEILARNSKGALTRNYTEAYYQTNSLSQPNFTLLSDSFGAQRLSYQLRTDGWIAGRYQANAENFVFERSTDLRPDGPFFDERFSITIEQPDHDGVALRSPDINQTSLDSLIELEGGLNLLYGRLVLNDISGSELEPLPILGLVEAFSYASNPRQAIGNEQPFFRPASFDQCTVIIASQLKRISGPQVNLNGSDNTLIQGQINDDQFNWILAEPFVKDNAELYFRYDIGSQPWLGFPWRDPDVNQSPEATAIFGQFRGNDRVINWLERGF